MQIDGADPALQVLPLVDYGQASVMDLEADDFEPELTNENVS